MTIPNPTSDDIASRLRLLIRHAEALQREAEALQADARALLSLIAETRVEHNDVRARVGIPPVPPRCRGRGGQPRVDKAS
jgi:hypothetical protein